MQLNKLRRRRARGVELVCRTIGQAIVVHGPDGITEQARALALSVAAEPDADVVIADLPAGSPSASWEALALALPPGSRELRLLPGTDAIEGLAVEARWLSERLGRTVLAPDGPVIVGSSGVMFVGSGSPGNWTRLAPGNPSQVAPRLTMPSWHSSVLACSGRIGPGAAAEPLPAGAWLRPDGRQVWLDADRARLARWLCVQSGVPTVVLGGHGTSELQLEDVARWWEPAPREIRAKARFVLYGPVQAPAGDAPGQALADKLGVEVICYAGLPIGNAEVPKIVVPRSDGSHGWVPFSLQVAYSPRYGGVSVRDTPAIEAHRRPPGNLVEVAPAVYRADVDAVVEVVQAGLWVRPPHEVTHAGTVRGKPAEQDVHIVFYEAGGEEQATRMRELAAELSGRFDVVMRQATKIVPVVPSGSFDGQPAGNSVDAVVS
jgi:hypothetical protein